MSDAEVLAEVRAAIKEMRRLRATAITMGAVSPDGHIMRGIERHALNRIIAAAAPAPEEGA